jgi:hypothetical protein
MLYAVLVVSFWDYGKVTSASLKGDCLLLTQAQLYIALPSAGQAFLFFGPPKKRNKRKLGAGKPIDLLASHGGFFRQLVVPPQTAEKIAAIFRSGTRSCLPRRQLSAITNTLRLKNLHTNCSMYNGSRFDYYVTTDLLSCGPT